MPADIGHLSLIGQIGLSFSLSRRNLERCPRRARARFRSASQSLRGRSLDNGANLPAHNGVLFLALTSINRTTLSARRRAYPDAPLIRKLPRTIRRFSFDLFHSATTDKVAGDFRVPVFSGNAARTTHIASGGVVVSPKFNFRFNAGDLP